MVEATVKNILKLKDQQLEDAFEDLISGHFELDNYFVRSGQVMLTDLDPNIGEGQHLEIDGVLLFNRTAVLFEFTGQKNNIRTKIRKFTRSCNLFVNSGKSLREKFSLFGSIPEDILSDFEEVNDWRFAFFGTSEDIDRKQLSPQNFPDHPEVREKLSIFGRQNIEYITQLCDLINKYARYEFLSALKLSPHDLEEDQLIRKKFIPAENRYVTESNTIKADVFLMTFKVKELLEIGRVSRYEGIPFALESEDHNQYQRFLVKSKLKNISAGFIRNQRRKIFPNTVTLVLSTECYIDPNDESKLVIPKKYSSIDIIDGQHRIFAYTDSSICQEVLDNGVILASAIKFQSTNNNTIKRNAAKVFCEINSKQAKVKNSLLYLIKYDVLGDKDSIALAGKVILECNKGNSALGNLFLVNTLIKKNKYNLPPIPIVTIVGQDLCKLFEGEGIDCELIDPDGYRDTFGHSRDYLRAHTDVWYKKGKSILEFYFNKLSEAFPNDFKENSDSLLLSSKYISALIKLLRYFLIDKEKELSEIPSEIQRLKNSVNRIVSPSNEESSFPRGNTSIPSTKHGIKTIFDFLKHPSSRWR